MSLEPAATDPSARAQNDEASSMKPTPAEVKMTRKTAFIFNAAIIKKRFRAAAEIKK